MTHSQSQIISFMDGINHVKGLLDHNIHEKDVEGHTHNCILSVFTVFLQMLKLFTFKPCQYMEKKNTHTFTRARAHTHTHTHTHSLSLSLAIQPFGPWPVPQFLNLIHSQ
jgi:hypothetical protein